MKDTRSFYTKIVNSKVSLIFRPEVKLAMMQGQEGAVETSTPAKLKRNNQRDLAWINSGLKASSDSHELLPFLNVGREFATALSN